jgi:cysteine synthase A
MGAEVFVCPANVPVDDSRSYYEVAKRIHKETPNSVYINQYFNSLNIEAHYATTGPEIWEQTNGKVDGFVCASGTGGTIGGVSKYLKEKNKDIKIYLSDPTGSALYNHIMNGELKAEGGSITEGIGSSRITKNFAEAQIDGAFSISDHESLPILYDLIQNEGLSLGTSCGVNIAGAIRLGKELGPGKTIVTILCDKSDKYNSKMFNKTFLKEKNLPIPSWL